MIRMETKGDADIRKALSVALAGAGLPILSMNRSEKSLEDIFLELTNVEPESGTASGQQGETENEMEDENESQDETESDGAQKSENETENDEVIEPEGGKTDDSDL